MAFFFIFYKGLLVYCIENNDYPALLSSIKQGCNVNIQDVNNFTPLHYAIFKGFLPLAATLLQAHADPDIPDKYTVFFLTFIEHPFSLLLGSKILEQ